MFLYYFLLYFLCTFFVTFFYTFHTLSLLLQRFHCVANDTVGTRYRATDSARIAAVSDGVRWKRSSAASCLKAKFVIVLPRSAPSPTVVNSVTGAYDDSSLTATKGVTAPSVIFVRKRTFSRIQSAHSRAMAFWVNSLRSLNSNAVPYRQ